MSGRVDGVRVVISGAGSGLGEGFAVGLAAEGAKVGVLDLRPEAAEAVAHRITEAGDEA
ncbi:MAG: SDR family NAD(P)-dependent oxidoreductase, partial [Actinomycetales bacterium]